SLLRWFEQVNEAVEHRWWNKLIILIVVPPAVWLFRSRVSAGRPTALPQYEPAMGFGTTSSRPRAQANAPSDAPPPGTPKEFMGIPEIPAKKKRGAAAVD